MVAKGPEGGVLGAGASPENVDPGAELLFANLHKFTKLAAQSVAVHGVAVRPGQRVPHRGARQGRIKDHGAGQDTRTQVNALSADAGEGGTALDAADQALRR